MISNSVTTDVKVDHNNLFSRLAVEVHVHLVNWLSLKSTRGNHIEVNVDAVRDITRTIGRKRGSVMSGILRGLAKTHFCSNTTGKQVWQPPNFSFMYSLEFEFWCFEKCEFCQKWDFKNVNFVRNETLKMWVLTKMRFQNCEFCQKWEFEIVNFVKNEILKLWILWKVAFSKCEFLV